MVYADTNHANLANGNIASATLVAIGAAHGADAATKISPQPANIETAATLSIVPPAVSGQQPINPPQAGRRRARQDFPDLSNSEVQVLACLLTIGYDAWAEASGLTPKDFETAPNSLLFGAIAAVAQGGGVIDVATVSANLADGGADMMPDMPNLMQRLQGETSDPNALGEHFAKLKDRANRRAVLVLAAELSAAARSEQALPELLGAARQQLSRMEQCHLPPTGPKPVTLDLRSLAQARPPERQWFIQDWLGPFPTLFAAAGGMGKSLLQQVLATSLAIGTPVLGAIPQPRRSMVWSCEDDADELWRRQHDICAHFDVRLDEVADNLILHTRRGVDSILMATDGGRLDRTPVFEELRQQVNDLAVDVLWLDNVAHLFGGDENVRGPVTTFINALAGLVTGRPFAVVMLAHNSRHAGSEFAGSAAWENAVRMRWYLDSGNQKNKEESGEAAAVEDSRYLSKRKTNYSAKDSIRFVFRNDVLVPDHGHATKGAAETAENQLHAEEVVIAGFIALKNSGIHPTDGNSSPYHLPKAMREKQLNQGLGKTSLVNAMNRLMANGRLLRGDIGKHSNGSRREGLILNEVREG